MKPFKFLNNSPKEKHIAVICLSTQAFHRFHLSQRAITGRGETDFLHTRFGYNGNYFYCIKQPTDINGLMFTHYYFYNFSTSDFPWGEGIRLWLQELYNATVWDEPYRINV